MRIEGKRLPLGERFLRAAIVFRFRRDILEWGLDGWIANPTSMFVTRRRLPVLLFRLPVPLGPKAAKGLSERLMLYSRINAIVKNGCYTVSNPRREDRKQRVVMKTCRPRSIGIFDVGKYEGSV